MFYWFSRYVVIEAAVNIMVSIHVKGVKAFLNVLYVNQPIIYVDLVDNAQSMHKDVTNVKHVVYHVVY